MELFDILLKFVNGKHNRTPSENATELEKLLAKVNVKVYRNTKNGTSFQTFGSSALAVICELRFLTLFKALWLFFLVAKVKDSCEGDVELVVDRWIERSCDRVSDRAGNG